MTSSINMLNWNSHQNLNNISFIEVEFIAQLLYLLCSVPSTLSMFSCSPPSFHHANLFLFLSISPLSLSVSIPLMTQVSRIKYYTQEGLLKQYNYNILHPCLTLCLQYTPCKASHSPFHFVLFAMVTWQILMFHSDTGSCCNLNVYCLPTWWQQKVSLM